MKFTPAKLRHKLHDTLTEGYRCEMMVRGITVDVFVYRDSYGWCALHYPSGFVLGDYLSRPTRRRAAEETAGYLGERVSDYVLSLVDRRSFRPERCWAAPCEAV